MSERAGCRAPRGGRTIADPAVEERMLALDVALAAVEWRTEPDGPGSGDDRYGDVPAQEEAA